MLIVDCLGKLCKRKKLDNLKFLFVAILLIVARIFVNSVFGGDLILYFPSSSIFSNLLKSIP